MRLTIEIAPGLEARLSAVARIEGVDPAALVQKLVADHVREAEIAAPPSIEPQNIPQPPDAENQAAIALLQSWIQQDATDDPDEILAAELELEEFRRNLNANRAATGERPVYP